MTEDVKINTTTNFEQIAYWKKRMNDRIFNIQGQWVMYGKEILQNADHINLKRDKIKETLQAIYESFEELYKAIESAEVKKDA